MVCKSCGMQINGDGRFCTNCGSSDLVESAAAETVVNGKICPTCQNVCYDEDFFCVKCGYTFGFQPRQNEKTAKTVVRKSTTMADVVRIIAIVMSILSILGNINLVCMFFAGKVYSYNPIPDLLYIVANVVVIIGLIKADKNPLPAIGYLLMCVSIVASPIIYGGSFPIYKIFIVAAYILIAVLFFIKTGFVKKIWFAPAILYLISKFFYLLEFNFVGSLFDIGVTIGTSIAPAIGLALAGYVSSVLWLDADEPEESATQFLNIN